jgi:hypothetical protein
MSGFGRESDTTALTDDCRLRTTGIGHRRSLSPVTPCAFLTVSSLWTAGPKDYDLGVWVLCNQANRAREQATLAREEHDVSAETSEGAHGRINAQ